ncbi:hypothetical protein EV06_0149 [Prochlorococcus sp. MIT 0602]|nr:hypothetical protein EV07_1411 [Prochlorococcus sp. MIT 0603]KGG18023.1 hypothetical protein EV06_0149 [Prochlorococcus sp. MIT 0602]
MPVDNQKQYLSLHQQESGKESSKIIQYINELFVKANIHFANKLNKEQ